MGGQTARPKSSPAHKSPTKRSTERPNAAKKEEGEKQLKPKVDNDHGKGTKRSKSIPKEKKQPSNVHFKDKKDQQRATTLLGDVGVLGKNERPSSKLWWLAGGRTRGSRGVPTAGELRDRRKVEEANRAAVGFLGTILGVRAVKKVPKKAEVKGEPKKAEEKEAKKAEETKKDDNKKSSEPENKKEKDAEKQPSNKKVKKKGEVKKHK